MSGWMRAVALAMITLFLGFVLKELGFRGTRLYMILGAVGVVSVAVMGLSELISELSFLGEGDEGEYVESILKILGIGYVVGVCSDICLDLGEPTLSGAVLTLGRLEMLAVAMPCLISVVKKGVELI